MKRLALSLSLAASIALANAEGYQVNTFSAKQEGMGHVGVAMKLGAESQIFNPGALAYMGKTMEISGSVSAISSTVDCIHGDHTYTTDNKMSTPMNASAAFRIYDNLYAGITFFTPYGSSINWQQNWHGAALNQSVDLKVFTVQPTFSWRIIPKLSVGAGLMISWGNVNLNKGLVSASSFAQLVSLLTRTGQLPASTPEWNDRLSPASANLVGTAETVLGYNVGIFYDINEKFNVGVSYRSKMMMKVKSGDVSVSYANDISEGILGSTLHNLNSTNFAAQMPCPYILTAGVSYKPTKRLELAFDAQLNGWGTYKWLDIEFAEQSAFNQHLKKDYHNAMTYHLGGQYAMTDRLDLRAGLMIDTSPCNTEYYNPETPGTTKIEPSVGLSFRPIKGLSIDLAFMYVHGARINQATGQFDDFLAPIYNNALAQYDAVLNQMGYPASGLQPLPETGKFTADYKLHALIPAIGISYSF